MTNGYKLMINNNKRRPKMKKFIVYHKSTNDGGALAMMCKVDFGSKLKSPHRMPRM
jgi:hypothetical protein